MKGKCKICGGDVTLADSGQWIHANQLVGISEHMRYAVGQALSSFHALAGPAKGGGQ